MLLPPQDIAETEKFEGFERVAVSGAGLTHSSGTRGANQRASLGLVHLKAVTRAVETVERV